MGFSIVLINKMCFFVMHCKLTKVINWKKKWSLDLFVKEIQPHIYALYRLYIDPSPFFLKCSTKPPNSSFGIFFQLRLISWNSICFRTSAVSFERKFGLTCMLRTNNGMESSSWGENIQNIWPFESIQQGQNRTHLVLQPGF